jgi:hypothetical protein
MEILAETDEREVEFNAGKQESYMLFASIPSSDFDPAGLGCR